MSGTYEVEKTDQGVTVTLTPENGGEPVRLFVMGDAAHVTVGSATSGPMTQQGQSGQTAAAALRAAL